MRSNLTVGYVELDNSGFVDPVAYKRTVRASMNLLWMPTSRVDIGGEVLWVMRENEDGRDGDARPGATRRDISVLKLFKQPQLRSGETDGWYPHEIRTT